MNNRKSGSRTLLMSVLMSSPGPLVVGLGLMAGRSSTQIADFVRRSSELLAIIMAFAVYRLTSGEAADEAKKARLERLSNIFVGVMMCIGGGFMLALAFMSDGGDKGNVIPGLSIAVLGVIANTLFWRKYSKLNRAEPNAILAVQARLYRAKSLVDCCVTAALLSVAIAPASPVSAWLDFIGSVIVSLYLIYCGLQTVWENGRKYPIKAEFFPWSLFAPPISESFLSLAVPHMKPPGALWRDRELDVREETIDCYDTERIRCFVISPAAVTGNAPCLLYLHGGGFVLEAAGYHYRNAMRYARELGCRVVFPLYRLAPKHPHPVFFEDCYTALCWLWDRAEELKIDRERIAIGGDSAGSTLAVGVCMLARQRKHPVRLRFQMLPYPYLDGRNESESCKRFTDTPMWNSSLSGRIAPMTRADSTRPDYTLYSPVEAESFDYLPPAYIETAEFDCLHDDGILYARLLEENGVVVTLNETRGTMHGFDIAEKAPTTLAAMEQRIAFMKKYF